MPIPTPTGSDQKHLNLGPCIRALRKEGETDSDKRIAWCMGLWRKAHGIPEPKEKK